MKNKIPLVALICCFGFSGNSAVAAPIGTSFTYQGHLMIAAQLGNGYYDFQFTLFDQASNGTIVAEPITNSSVRVSNGLFTVQLDFGAAAFGGAARWLELAARSNGIGGFSTLAPRQNLTPTPYAFHAANISSSALAGVYSNAVSFINPGNSFAGDGIGLTNILRTIGWFNVADFGGIPNDNISDTLAIQAAIDAAAINGGVVFFPPGEFTLGPERPYPAILDVNILTGHLMILSNNITLQGSGKGVTVLRRAGGGKVGNLIQTLDGHTENFTVRDMTLDAGHSLIYNMTSIRGGKNHYWSRIQFQNHDDDALEMAFVDVVTVRDCTFSNIAANAVSFVPATSAMIEGCFFENVGFSDPAHYTTAPFHFPGNWAAIQVRNGSYKISNTVVTNSGTALQHTGGDLRVDNCTFYAAATSLTNIYLINGNSVFANCQITHGTGLGIYAGPVNYNSGGQVGSGGTLTLDNSQLSGTGTIVHSVRSVTIQNGSTLSAQSPNYTTRLTGIIKISDSTILNNRHSTIRIISPAVEGAIITGNKLSGGNITCEAAMNNSLFANNDLLSFAGMFLVGEANKIAGNRFNGTLTIGGNDNRFDDNNINVLAWSGPRVGYFRGNLFGTEPIHTAPSVNLSTWEGNTTANGAPLRNFTITTNYTATALDSVLRFNGSLLTSTIPSAVVVNKRKQFTIVNLHSSALEVTNATGAQTFSGALRLSLPQFTSRTIESDGANWQIISSYTP